MSYVAVISLRYNRKS